MKKIHALFLLMASAIVLHAGVIEKTYTFNNPTVVTKNGYQMLYFENTMITGKSGEPALPYQSVQLLLPPGEKAVSIEFIGEDEVLLSGDFNIFPQQISRPLSQPTSGQFSYNEDVYKTNALFPTVHTGQITTQYLNGYAFALSSFTPVRYNPVSKELYLFRKVTIRITTESSFQSSEALKNIRSGEKDIPLIQSFAQNEEMVRLYPSKSRSTDDYELLIITPSMFSGFFDDLLELYLKEGIRGQLVSRETINGLMTGQDMAEKIRNYIIQEYQDHSIQYVLLGGDVEHIPYRGMYCYVTSGSGYEDDDIPSDLYYSALDGNWNTDGDSKWGEPGEDDLLPEVAVGRLPFSNVSELNNMLHKTIFYQTDPVLGEFNDVLFAGEYLLDDPETWGSDYLELLIGNQTENGYETNGIPLTYDFQKLYEETQPWGSFDLMSAVNSGKQFVHHVGHANYDYVAFMSNWDITNVNFSGANGIDHNYTIFQSHGCICGAFDESDCVMEEMMKISNFAVAVIGNSRYGWFNEGQTEGPAAHLHREMMDALYHEKINRIGAAFVETKIQTAPWVTAPGQWEEGALRWNFYDINIFGDPMLAIWTEEPIDIETVYEDVLWIDDLTTDISVTASSIPMPDMSCAILKDGILYGVGITDTLGNVTITFDPLFPTSGNAVLVVSGNNVLPHEYPIQLLAVSVEEMNDSELSIYPNPASTEIIVDVNEIYATNESVLSIYNQAGQLVYQQKITTQLTMLDISRYANGNYSVRIENSQGSIYSGFTKVK